MTTRVVIADDQALVRAGFRMIIDAQDDMKVVAEAADGAQAVRAARDHAADIVLMDIRMPTMDGIDAARAITGVAGTGVTGTGDPPRVVILTTYDLDEYVFDALDAGASGFLLKDTPPEDLVRAVRLTAGGQALLDPAVTRRLIAEFTKGRPRAEAAARLAPLTDRERDVLRLVARGCSNTEIAGALYVAESTVKTHVGHILDKLGARDRVHAVIAAYEAGLVRPGTENPPASTPAPPVP